VLSSAHRAGAFTPAAGRFRASTALSAILVSMMALSPLAAHAADPSKTFDDKTLTDDDDVITNSKSIDLTEDIDFGAGGDALTNNGTITIGAKSTTPVQVTLISLEALRNTGTIDMRNGHVGDVLTPDGADKLVVGDVANGSTAIVLGGLSAKSALLTGDKGPVLVQAGAGSKADAFTVENYEIGLIHYDLVFDAATNSYRLKGVAGQRVYEALKISEGATSVWRQSADAWSAHVASLRDAGSNANGAGVWGQAYGGRQDRDDEIAASAQRKVAVDYEQTTYGGQMGVDLINGGLDDGRITLGLTGGYADSKMRFSGVAGQEAKLSVINVGGYVALTNGGFFVNALAKADRQSIKVNNTVDGIDSKVDGTAYGAQVEAGHRFGEDGLAYETLLGVNYVSARLDDMETLGQRLDFDNATGFVAKAGLRGSAQSDLLGGALTTYGAAFVAHDFSVKSGVTLVSGDQSEHLSKDGGRTFGQLTVGASYRTSSGAITFVEAGGDYGGGRSGGGLRVGARFGF
jgi:hypothetical protein